MFTGGLKERIHVMTRRGALSLPDLTQKLNTVARTGMPLSRKRQTSGERDPAAPKLQERAQFNPQHGHAKSRSYLLPNERLRQQTLTQIDFVSYVPREEPDLNFIEGGEPLRGNAEEGYQEVRVNAKTATAMTPPVLPTTPRRKRKLEIPDSHSPPSSPFSPYNMENSPSLKSPLATKTEQLLSDSTSKPETTQVIEQHPIGVLRNNVSWGNEDSLISLQPPLLVSQDFSENAGAEGSGSGDHSKSHGASFGEESDGTIASRIEDDTESSEESLRKSTDGVPGVVVKTEIRDSDEGDSEYEYDFGPETQAIVDNIDLAYLSESFSKENTSSPSPALEVNIASALRTSIDDTDTESISGGIQDKAMQVALEGNYTNTESGSDKYSQTYGPSSIEEIRDAQIQPVHTASNVDGEPSQFQPSTPFSRASLSTTSSEATLRSIEVQSISTLPPGHIGPRAPRSTDSDIRVNSHARTGLVSTRIYDFETASQLLPESLMNDSLPLPPDFSQEFFDEDDHL